MNFRKTMRSFSLCYVLFDTFVYIVYLLICAERQGYLMTLFAMEQPSGENHA
jgi:hypothetical protein